MIKFLIQLTLLVVGILIFPLLFVVGLIYTIIKHCIRLNYSFSEQFTPIIRNFNLALDGLANAGAGELLNDVFKVEGNLRFGKWYQTISAVTGLLFLYVKEIKLKRILDNVLGDNHCVEAISKEDLFYYKEVTNSNK